MNYDIQQLAFSSTMKNTKFQYCLPAEPATIAFNFLLCLQKNLKVVINWHGQEYKYHNISS